MNKKKQEKKIKTKQILQVYLQHIRRYKGRVFLILLVTVLAKVLDVFVPLLYKRFLTSFLVISR